MTAADVEDLYDLTPLQHGLLFHCLYAPEEGVYVEQAYLTLRGALDHDAFWAAWQAVYDRHPALRSTYHWDGIKAPVQAVHRQFTLHRDERDWRAVPPAEQEPKLRAFLEEERHRGLDLEALPLMRLSLVRTTDEQYYLAMRISHLIMDGWSVGIILGEFIASYRARYHGRTAELPRPAGFREYVAWWKRQDPAAVQEYWRSYLAGFVPPQPLRMGTAEADADTAQPYYRVDHSLADLADDLRAFCRSRGLTLHTVIQGAWMLVLSRCSGAAEVMAGATMAHRPPDVRGVDTIVGPMVLTLPIRVAVTEDLPVLDWLRRIQDDIIAARDHAGAPLTDIRGWSDAPRSTDLFESIVSFENVPLPTLEFPDENLSLVDYVFDGRPQYPLSFVVLPGDDLPLRLVYDRRRFSADTAQAMLARVRAALLSIMDRPAQALDAVEILPEAERARLARLHRAVGGVPVDECLPDGIARHARERPDAVALTGEHDQVTYAELDRRANQLAHRLRAVGVRPGDRVALCAERTPRTVVAMIAILRAGAAYVPLDPQQPPDRLAFMIDDCAAAALVTEASLRDRCGKHRAVPVDLDGDRAAIKAAPVTAPEVAVRPDDVAYVVYTSGSTGAPKGTLMTHANGLRLVRSMDRILEVTAEDVWTCLHTFAFDASVWEIWAALDHGSRLVVVPATVTRAADAIYQLLVEQRVTVLLLTPRVLEQLIVIEPPDAPPLPLRYLLVGADRVEPTALRPWFERHGDERPVVLNVYGPTETTVFCATHHIRTAETAGEHAPSNIGRPVADTAIYLLDARYRPVPFGAVGELCISGPGLGQGYLNRPELTAQRFVDDPIRPGHRMYRSGDLARYTADGELEYLGRADSQVKIRGFRVELGEIEFALRQHPQVDQAAVVLRQDDGDQARLTAYLVPADGSVAVDEVRDHLTETLPSYMIPAAFVELSRIPVNANGKLDARLLPAPGQQVWTEDYAPPRSDIERRLAVILADLLRVDRVGRDDNLLDRGLHSLLATGVAARIREEWQLPVPLRAIFETPTVAALATIIESGVSSVVAPDRPGVVDLAAEAALPTEIRPAPAARPAPAGVLLTGATGLLGGALAAGLLTRIDRPLYCLVRARDRVEARRRVEENLRTLGLWQDSYADRIVAVAANLAQPALGLGDDGFADLADRVGEVYHCGAMVNFVQPYRRLRATNVGGTTEVLRLAVTGPTKPVHFVSTGAVLGQWRHDDGDPGPAGELPLPAAPPTHLLGGYPQSKWVAERLVTQAAERGLPVDIYRSGRITGDSVTGKWRPGDAGAEMLRACAVLGEVPEFEGAVDMTPIDYVRDGVLELAAGDPAGRVYHLTNPRPVDVNEIAAGLRAAGYGDERVRVQKWYAHLVQVARRAPQQEWAAALGVLGQWVHTYAGGLREPAYDSSRAQQALRGRLTCPPVDADLIARYLRHFADIGYIPASRARTPAGTST